MKFLVVFFSIFASISLFAGDCCSKNGYFFTDVSWLYWQPIRNNLDYSNRIHVDIVQPIPPKIVFTNFDSNDINFSWNSGVEATIGYGLCHCGWNFFLSGLYYQSSMSDSMAAEGSPTSGVALKPIINPGLMGASALTSDAEWKLKFGQLDLLAAGCFSPWRCVALMPNFGLRGVWIDQHFDVNYDGITYFLTSSPFSITAPHGSFSNFKTFQRGIGFKAGVDFESPLFCNISLVGGVGGSVLYSRVDIHQNASGFLEESPQGTPVLSELHFDYKQKIDKPCCNIESELGLSYRSCFCWGVFDLSASYAFSLWFDQNEFASVLFTSQVVTGGESLLNGTSYDKKYTSLLLHGLVLKADFVF